MDEKVAKNDRIQPFQEPEQDLPESDLIVTSPKRGKLSLKYRTIAEYAARGYSPRMISKIVGMRSDWIRQILEHNEAVQEHIGQILNDLFQEGDMLLVHLYKKALEKLDSEMESTDPEIRHKAIEKVLRQAMASAGKGEEGSKTLIAQFFGGTQGSGGSGGVGVESMDEVILRKRKERGLLE